MQIAELGIYLGEQLSLPVLVPLRTNEHGSSASAL